MPGPARAEKGNGTERERCLGRFPMDGRTEHRMVEHKINVIIRSFSHEFVDRSYDFVLFPTHIVSHDVVRDPYHATRPQLGVAHVEFIHQWREVAAPANEAGVYAGWRQRLYCIQPTKTCFESLRSYGFGECAGCVRKMLLSSELPGGAVFRPRMQVQMI